MWASMLFSARPSLPTSVRSSSSTRCERSPAAIAAAVLPIASRGFRPIRTTQRPRTVIASSATAVTSSSIRSRRWSVLSTLVQRGGDQQDPVRGAGLDRRADAVAAAAADRADGEEVDAVAVAGVRLAGRVIVAGSFGPGAASESPNSGMHALCEDRLVRLAQLDAVAGDRVEEPWRFAAGAGAAGSGPRGGEEGVLDAGVGRVERAVDAVVEERLQRRVRGEVRGDEPAAASAITPISRRARSESRLSTGYRRSASSM